MVGNNVDLKNAGCTWDEDFTYWKLASKGGYKHDEDIFSYNISRLFNTHPMIKVAPHEPKDPFIWKLGMKHKIQLSVAVVTQPEKKYFKQASGDMLEILPRINGIIATDYQDLMVSDLAYNLAVVPSAVVLSYLLI